MLFHKVSFFAFFSFLSPILSIQAIAMNDSDNSQSLAQPHYNKDEGGDAIMDENDDHGNAEPQVNDSQPNNPNNAQPHDVSLTTDPNDLYDNIGTSAQELIPTEHKVARPPNIEDLSDDAIIKCLSFLNGFDYCHLLFVDKKLSYLFWQSIVTLTATTPHQMDNMKHILKKIKAEHPERLLQIQNIGWWSLPGKVKFPVDQEVMAILHLCQNAMRVFFGKGQHILDVKAEDFQLLNSLHKLELLEIDHTDLDSSAFTDPIKSTCRTKDCLSCSKEVPASLLASLPNLKSFRVRGVNCLPLSPMIAQLKNSQDLKRLGIWGSGQIWDSEIHQLIGLTNLTEVILSSCISSGDRSVFKVLTKLKLQHLGLFYAQNNHEEQDKDFRSLSGIPSLTSFHVGGWNLTNQAFAHLKDNSNLQNLSISRAQALSRAGFIFIALNSTITTLRISACIFIRDFDLAPLINMTQLQRLDLDNTKSVTDNFLKFMALKSQEGHNPVLQEIYLMGIPLISNKGMVNMMGIQITLDNGKQCWQGFKALNLLVIKNCQNVTEESVRQLRNNKRWRITLDNSEYIQKQQQQAQQQQQARGLPLQQAPHIALFPQIVQQLQTIELQIQQKLANIEEQQPLQNEQALQANQQYQEQLQVLHNMLHNQQRLQQQMQQLLAQNPGLLQQPPQNNLRDKHF